ncbi:MAG TPA: hypothetical protein VM784_08140 [Actinomycetota bacterium]|nr:hypothetical protein [Actinomycetota bacterium]
MNKRTFSSLAAALLALTMSACGGGIDAGTNGGVAFVVLTIFLVFGCVVLYIALGRGE